MGKFNIRDPHKHGVLIMLDYLKDLISEMYQYEWTKPALFLAACASIYAGLCFLAPGSIFTVFGCLILWFLFKKD